MCVITISRETGSEGRYIAEQVAKTLGYPLVDKNTIGRVFSLYGAEEFGMEVGYVPEFWTQFTSQIAERRQSMVEMLNHVILAIAHHNNVVILGRSSFAVLAGFADVLNVRVQAPLSIRIRRVKEQLKVAEPAQAETIVKESDRVRTAFIQQFYGHPWDKSEAFDIVIDTSKVAPITAVSWLTDAAHGLSAQNVHGSRTTSTIQVDPTLASIIANEFQPVSGRGERDSK